MKTDLSWLDDVRMLSTMRFGGLVVAAAIAMGAALAGLVDSEQCWDAEATQSDLRVVRASVTWREGADEVSVVHVDERVREAAPRVVVTERRERRTHFDDMSIVGREIRTAVSTVMVVVRLLASGKMDG